MFLKAQNKIINLKDSIEIFSEDNLIVIKYPEIFEDTFVEIFVDIEEFECVYNELYNTNEEYDKDFRNYVRWYICHNLIDLIYNDLTEEKVSFEITKWLISDLLQKAKIEYAKL